MIRRLGAQAALVLAVALVVGRCVPKTPDVEIYREPTRLNLGTAVSEVGTTRLTLTAACHFATRWFPPSAGRTWGARARPMTASVDNY